MKSHVYLTENLAGDELPPVLWRWPVGLLSQKKNNKKNVNVLSSKVIYVL